MAVSRVDRTVSKMADSRVALRAASKAGRWDAERVGCWAVCLVVRMVAHWVAYWAVHWADP